MSTFPDRMRGDAEGMDVERLDRETAIRALGLDALSEREREEAIEIGLALGSIREPYASALRRET